MIDQWAVYEKERKLQQAITSAMTDEGVSLLDATVYAQQHSASFVRGSWTEDSLADLNAIVNTLPNGNSLLKKVAYAVDDYMLNFAQMARLELQEHPVVERTIGQKISDGMVTDVITPADVDALDYFESIKTDTLLSEEDREYFIINTEVPLQYDTVTVSDFVKEVNRIVGVQNIIDSRIKNEDLQSSGPLKRAR